MLASNVESVACRLWAICLKDLQNASSRLMLVLCPETATERLTTRDFNTIHTPQLLTRYIRAMDSYLIVVNVKKLSTVTKNTHS